MAEVVLEKHLFSLLSTDNELLISVFLSYVVEVVLEKHLFFTSLNRQRAFNICVFIWQTILCGRSCFGKKYLFAILSTDKELLISVFLLTDVLEVVLENIVLHFQQTKSF